MLDAPNKSNEMRANQASEKAREKDVYGLVRFNKKTKEATFECWLRFADLSKRRPACFACSSCMLFSGTIRKQPRRLFYEGCRRLHRDRLFFGIGFPFDSPLLRVL
jgi:hypothetical protein